MPGKDSFFLLPKVLWLILAMGYTQAARQQVAGGILFFIALLFVAALQFGTIFASISTRKRLFFFSFLSVVAYTRNGIHPSGPPAGSRRDSFLYLYHTLP
jgi:hypothetical protein